MTSSFNKCFALLGVLLLGSVGIVGCAKEPVDNGVESGASSAKTDAHNHPTEGPHHGSLIELGNEEYHAELVHDEQAGSVTIYVLDSAGTTAVPIDVQDITMNLSHEGQAEQFTLAAEPDTGDPAGLTSRFVSTSADLAEELDHDHAEAQLVITIAGKQYRGAVQHDHDHEGHAH